MRVLVCPTAFKESMDVHQVVDAMAAGVRQARPDAFVRRLPVSDGGPGFLDALRAAEGGILRTLPVSGPLGGSVQARALWRAADEVSIEAADACGLHLMPEPARKPLHASSRGLGELVAACVAEGARVLAIGLGGSGTVDGGSGMATALGYRLRDDAGADLSPGGGALTGLGRIERGVFPSLGWEGYTVTAVADVASPLLGPDGSARRFALQKGVRPAEIPVLERGLSRLAERWLEDLGCDVADHAGAGAAGGLGGGCAAFLGAALVLGSEWVLDRIGFDAELRQADLVITGEGAWDATSGLGKVVWEIARRTSAASVPLMLVCGRVDGAPPDGATVLHRDGRWLTPEDVASMVAEAVE